jgi:hypothetical protein
MPWVILFGATLGSTRSAIGVPWIASDRNKPPFTVATSVANPLSTGNERMQVDRIKHRHNSSTPIVETSLESLSALAIMESRHKKSRAFRRVSGRWGDVFWDGSSSFRGQSAIRYNLDVA